MSRLASGYELYSVIVGEHNTETHPDCQDEVCNNDRREYFVEQVVSHERYNMPRYANDIGLIRVSQDINFDSDFVKPTCLPITNALVSRAVQNLIVSGWGTTETNAPSTELLRARLTVVPINDCKVALRQNQLTDDQLCAKGKGTIDTCQ